MIKIKYNNTDEKIECGFKIENSIVELKGGSENTSGFLTFRLDGETQLGDFSDYTTIYRVTDDAVQYSNDGSVCVESVEIPSAPVPVDDSPTVEERLEALESAMLEMILGVQNDSVFNFTGRNGENHAL